MAPEVDALIRVLKDTHLNHSSTIGGKYAAVHKVMPSVGCLELLRRSLLYTCSICSHSSVCVARRLLELRLA
jgi:hypothetical protein